MEALFSRAEARDFIDVDALLRAGYTRERLSELAAERDAGFDRRVLAQVVAAELGALYAAQVRGVAAGLPELPVRYADFAAWQRFEPAEGGLERASRTGPGGTAMSVAAGCRGGSAGPARPSPRAVWRSARGRRARIGRRAGERR